MIFLEGKIIEDVAEIKIPGEYCIRPKRQNNGDK